MKKIILLKGIPASGKSTRAKKMVKENPGVYKRVNKDDLREMLDQSHWSKSNEKFVLKVRDYIVEQALNEGKHVIVDDTNLHKKHEQRMEEIAKEVGNTRVEVREFRIDLEEAIERDLKRSNSVGQKVIKRMYKQMYEHCTRELYCPNPSKPKAVIFDVDGTLAIMKDRSPYDWDKVGNDELNWNVHQILKMYDDAMYKIIIFTGRDGVCKQETIDWLQRHEIPFDHFTIRCKGDTRKDSVVKKEMFDSIRDEYNIIGVFDDRDRVVDMRRSLGLTCFQVAEGDF